MIYTKEQNEKEKNEENFQQKNDLKFVKRSNTAHGIYYKTDIDQNNKSFKSFQNKSNLLDRSYLSNNEEFDLVPFLIKIKIIFLQLNIFYSRLIK